MHTPSQRLSIYFTAYCCLDGEECDLTRFGLCRLIGVIIGEQFWYCYMDPTKEFPELWAQKPAEADKFWFPVGSPGWPERKEILIKAIELTYKK